MIVPAPEALAASLRAIGIGRERASALSAVHPGLLFTSPEAYAETAAEARRLHAVRELAAAYVASRPCTGAIIAGPADIDTLVGPRLRSEAVEAFFVIFLATSGRVLAVEELTRGGLSSSIVEPRAVFRRAMAHNAAALVLAHNHPSGNAEPSREDVRVTKQLVEAGKLFGVPVRDHLIVTPSGYTSLAERGLM